MNDEQYDRIANGRGFIAALDQSGGSTPRALSAYGIGEDQWSNEDEMFDLMHQMRTRVITSPAFTSEHILAAILFEQTMDREVEGVPTPDYLWNEKGIVPFVKVDQGLAEEANGVQVMKEMTKLDSLLERAVNRKIFGTKMRSVVKRANQTGIEEIVSQQFYYAGRILDAGLVPILEPEVDIHAPDKAEAEQLLNGYILEFLNGLEGDRKVMLKLTPPAKDDLYADLIAHDRVVRVVALSGGWSREEVCERLARNHGLIASFSRALLGELKHSQSDEEFNETLAAAIKDAYEASIT